MNFDILRRVMSDEYRPAKTQPGPPKKVSLLFCLVQPPATREMEEDSGVVRRGGGVVVVQQVEGNEWRVQALLAEGQGRRPQHRSGEGAEARLELRASMCGVAVRLPPIRVVVVVFTCCVVGAAVAVALQEPALRQPFLAALPLPCFLPSGGFCSGVGVGVARKKRRRRRRRRSGRPCRSLPPLLPPYASESSAS